MGWGIKEGTSADIRHGSTCVNPTIPRAECNSCVNPAPARNGTVEEALAGAITKAVEDGLWDVVVQLARELEARRLAASSVIDLAVVRSRRKE